jgi:hypothetical protein
LDEKGYAPGDCHKQSGKVDPWDRPSSFALALSHAALFLYGIKTKSRKCRKESNREWGSKDIYKSNFLVVAVVEIDRCLDVAERRHQSGSGARHYAQR